MDNFSYAVEKLIKIEGGYVNDPDDPGGETNYGISKRSYPNLDIKNLNVEEAEMIYLKGFWLKNKLNKIENKEMACSLFLAIVHIGRVAITILQKSINNNFLYPNGKELLNVDEVMGENTLYEVNHLNPSLLKFYQLDLIKYYHGLISPFNHNNKYLLGWIKRALTS